MSDSFYKVGDKFLIEIGESYSPDTIKEEANFEQRKAPTNLYRIKGFNSLVFDGNGLNKLEKYNDKSDYISPDQVEKIKNESKTEGLEEGLLQGRQEMLDAIRKILISEFNGGFSIRELQKIFGTDERYRIINKNAEELIQKINEYEKREEENNSYSIVPGDIVTINSDGIRSVVLDIDDCYSADSNDFQYHVFTEVGTCEVVKGKNIQFAGTHSNDYDNMFKTLEVKNE